MSRRNNQTYGAWVTARFKILNLCDGQDLKEYATPEDLVKTIIEDETLWGIAELPPKITDIKLFKQRPPAHTSKENK